MISPISEYYFRKCVVLFLLVSKLKLSFLILFKLFVCRIAAGISNFFHKKDKDKASPTSTKSPPEMVRTKSPEIRRREMGTRSPEIRRRDTGEKESKTPELDRRPSPAARVRSLSHSCKVFSYIACNFDVFAHVWQCECVICPSSRIAIEKRDAGLKGTITQHTGLMHQD